MYHPKRPCATCGCFNVSRRHFLAASSAAFVTPFVAAAANERTPDEKLGEYIDISQFRPKPEVKITSVVVRHKPPYWLGWPGTSYDLEGHRAEYNQFFQAAAKRTGITLTIDPDPVEDDEAAKAFAAKVEAENPDAVLISMQHLSAWNLVDIIAKSGLKTIVFAPIGMAFTGHVVERSRRPKMHVISSLETSAVEQAMRMIRAKRQLEETRLLVIAGKDHKESVLERLGTKVRYIPRDRLHELFARMPVTDETHEVAERMRKGAENVVEPTEQDLLNAAQSYMTSKRLLLEESSNAVTSDCLGMVSSRVVPTPPCMGVCMFQDAGLTYGCEADEFGAMSLMLVSYLFDKCGFMNDPVPETVKNRLIVAHCVCGTRLNGFDQPPERYVLRSHSESDLGVALQVLWREGQRATLVRFQNPNQLILDTGTVMANVQTPPAGGCRTSVEIAMDRVEDARDVLGFHQVVFYGDHRRDLEAFCQMHGIKVINSPERAPKGAIT